MYLDLIKKFLFRNKYLISSFLLGFLYTIPLLNNSFYLSHDGEAHVARFAAYYQAFLDGQLRWAENLNYGYGSPVFIFYYPLPGILAVFIHLLGISFENTFKLLIGFSFILPFTGMFLWIKTFVREEVALVSALLYGLLPYHFLNLYVRGDIAELLALGIVPLVFLFIDRADKETSLINLLCTGIVYALLILSHNSVSLMFSPVLLLYVLFFSSSLTTRIKKLSALVIGLILSAFFWIPAIVESKYVNANLFIGDMFKEHFPTFIQLIYSPWGFGVNVFEGGGLSPQIGMIVLALSIGGIFFIFTKKDMKKRIFWSSIFTASVFFTLEASEILWRYMPFIKLFQFPWRIVGLTSFIAVMLSVYFLDRFRNVFLGVIVCIVLITSLSFADIKMVDQKPDEYYLSYKGTTYYHGQASSIWTAGDFSRYASNPAEVISGQADVLQTSKKSNLHTFTVVAEKDSKILDNTVYFPGWGVWVDGRQTPIEFQDPNHRGLITFNVPPGEHKIEVRFGESPIRLVADFISIIGIIGCLSMLTFRKKLDRYLSGK